VDRGRIALLEDFEDFGGIGRRSIKIRRAESELRVNVGRSRPSILLQRDGRINDGDKENFIMSDAMDDALREVCILMYCEIYQANNSQRLKASLWFSVGKIVDEESLRLNTNATPQFIGALTEMVWAQIGA
jgi:hypothetical protein